ncbi:MAG: glycoside hydrolase/phage tail family protein [Parvibaculaceae bacterium]
MATLVLSAAGQAVGSMFGGPLGGMIGRAAGAIAGSFIDQALFGPGPRKSEGPRLDDLRIMSSTEGSVIPRAWGRARLAGQVIWATNLEEVVSKRKEKAGAKGMGGASAKVTEYSYFANFAVGLCEGPIDRIGRVWADGKEIDLSGVTWRFYPGSEQQEPDSLIVAKEGGDAAPAYRGLAYVVFERLALERFGNRLPQLSFELFRKLDDVEAMISAVNIIPGTTEFGYDPSPVTRNAGWGETASENRHVAGAPSDWSLAMDQLDATCPNLEAASLVVAWFGDDLRVGHCSVRPKVEISAKTTSPVSWRVAGMNRGAAEVVSTVDGRPAFGGTPSDSSVIAAIRDLKDRGRAVTFYPFLMMDVPAGNALPDPYTGEAGQPAYPWRGRITCDPAPGRPGSPNKSAGIVAGVDAFFGTAAVGDFALAGEEVVYSGPAEWSFRRMVLHYAHLCLAAGGVEAFLIGSEMRGLTSLRSSATTYPAVAALVALAADVKAVLPEAKVSYAADWSEYFGHQPTDGSGDAFFHLDPLWASPDVDFVGIDNYMPLSDWRDGSLHLDALAGVPSIHDRAYLASNVAGGEGFDWFYASDSDRALQVRSPITDGAHGKPWVFRYKDLKGWWENAHRDRPGGVEAEESTAWAPRSKPIWFTEAGCPAVDKGTNRPNAFIDPQSSESALPWDSAATRDDFMQRRYVETLLGYWSVEEGRDPLSEIYGGRMVDPSRIFLWCWDARPWPVFPALSEVWSDGPKYRTGHWLNGRLGAAPLDALVKSVAEAYGLADVESTTLEGVTDGFVIDRVVSGRDALDPLAAVFSFDAVETGGRIAFRHRSAGAPLALETDRLVEDDPRRPLMTLTRAQETDLPTAVKLGYQESDADYRHAAVEARKLDGTSLREEVVETACVLSQGAAQPRAEVLLHEAWVGRETASFALPPSLLALEPGDPVTLPHGGGLTRFRIEEVSEERARRVKARASEPSVYRAASGPERAATIEAPPVFGPPRHLVLDLPMLTDGDNPHAPWIAVAARPWPGEIAVYADEPGIPTLNRLLSAPAVMGETLDPLEKGPLGRIDRRARLRVRLLLGALASVSREEFLAGANAAAVGDETRGFEVIQFESAELVASNTYLLSGLLRGQAGSDPEIAAVRSSGAQFVMLDAAVTQLDLGAGAIGRPLQGRAGPSRLDIADPAFATFAFTPKGIGLRPLAPGHLAARRDGTDIALGWIRRTRMGGDSWELVDVPLGEADERYALDILDGASVVRSVETTEPFFTYGAAEQASDFGAPLSTIRFRVAQLSRVYGRGAATEAERHV